MNTIFETVAYIHLVNKKVLLTKSKKHPAFYMPGGKLNEGETKIQALIRELKEELSIDLIEDSLHYYGVFESQAYARSQGTMVRITCYLGRHKGDILPNNEVEHADFFSHRKYSAMPETAPAARLILDDLKRKALIR